jgi:hypothetical protein
MRSVRLRTLDPQFRSLAEISHTILAWNRYQLDVWPAEESVEHRLPLPIEADRIEYELEIDLS